MGITLVGALTLALLPSALAFQSTSPLFVFSTAPELKTGLVSNYLPKIVGRADDCSEALKKKVLKDCPTSSYIVVRQPGVSSEDYLDHVSAPQLAAYTRNFNGTALELVGRLDVDDLIKYLHTTCKANVVSWNSATPEKEQQVVSDYPHVENSEVSVLDLTFSAPPLSSIRSDVLKYHDSSLAEWITKITRPDFTIIYTTTPPLEGNEPVYEMENPLDDGVRMELKRDTTVIRRASGKKQGGLFEKYQYFSPGLFMAFSAMVPLVLILIVGVKAITGLEVSYFAFSKEMGPTAQKKVQ